MVFLRHTQYQIGALHFGNYFALGLLVGRERAEQLFLDARTLFLAPLVVGYCNMFFSDIVTAVYHQPSEIQEGPITLRGFGSDLRFLTVVSINMLAVLACIAQFAMIFSKLFPRLGGFVAGCGSRTLYAYVLHLTLIDYFPLALWVHMCDPRLHVALFAILSLFLNVVLSSRGAERLFEWWLMPYWMQDVAKWFKSYFTSDLHDEG